MLGRVLVTRRIPDPALDLLMKECEVEINEEDRVLDKEEIIRRVRDKNALLCMLTDHIDTQVMDEGRNLQVIANNAVGYDNIDVAAATARRIPITNTPGVLTDTTADLTWALLMAVARRIAEADRFVREGKFKSWSPMLLLGHDIHRKTLGIVGFGRIGFAVARRAVGFKMCILYSDVQKANASLEEETGAQYVSLEILLRESDFVTLHVPLNPGTIHLIGEKQFKMMKKTAYLINTSRGPVIDEKALVKALKNDDIAGAGLDVYEKEPQITPELLKLNNVVLLPHIGSASWETRTQMALMAAENVLAVLRGLTPPNLVNPEVLKR